MLKINLYKNLLAGVVALLVGLFISLVWLPSTHSADDPGFKDSGLPSSIYAPEDNLRASVGPYFIEASTDGRWLAGVLPWGDEDVYLYQKIDNYWVFQQTLKSGDVKLPDGHNINFFSLDLDIDDHYLAILGEASDENGKAYDLIATFSLAGRWHFDQVVEMPTQGTKSFSTSLALDGSQLAVNDRDLVHIFGRKDQTWQIDQTLTVAGVQDVSSLDLHGDTLVLSPDTRFEFKPPSNPDQAPSTGQVNIYKRKATGWSLQTTLTSSNQSSEFGQEVTVNGSWLAVSSGNPYLNDGASVYFYEKESGWSFSGKANVVSDGLLWGSKNMFFSPVDENRLVIDHGSQTVSYVENEWVTESAFFVGVVQDGQKMAVLYAGPSDAPEIKTARYQVFEQEPACLTSNQVTVGHDIVWDDSSDIREYDLVLKEVMIEGLRDQQWVCLAVTDSQNKTVLAKQKLDLTPPTKPVVAQVGDYFNLPAKDNPEFDFYTYRYAALGDQPTCQTVNYRFGYWIDDLERSLDVGGQIILSSQTYFQSESPVCVQKTNGRGVSSYAQKSAVTGQPPLTVNLSYQSPHLVFDSQETNQQTVYVFSISSSKPLNCSQEKYWPSQIIAVQDLETRGDGHQIGLTDPLFRGHLYYSESPVDSPFGKYYCLKAISGNQVGYSQPVFVPGQIDVFTSLVNELIQKIVDRLSELTTWQTKTGFVKLKPVFKNK